MRQGNIEAQAWPAAIFWGHHVWRKPHYMVYHVCFQASGSLNFLGSLTIEPAQPGTAMIVEELASREEVLEVRISGMVGDSFTLRLDASTRGKDLLKMVRLRLPINLEVGSLW